jgi:hypothetical protein
VSLGLTQAEASRVFGFDQRSSGRWASEKHAVPLYLAMFLRMMLSGTLDAS